MYDCSIKLIFLEEIDDGIDGEEVMLTEDTADVWGWDVYCRVFIWGYSIAQARH